MIRLFGGVIGGVLRILLVVLLVSALGSLAVTTGAIDVGLADGEQIETPDPIPDWPFTWEMPIGDGHEQQPKPRSEPVDEPADEPDVGDPVREDPGPTSFESRETTVASTEIEARVHERINSIRGDNELSVVAHDDQIAGISRAHSHDMAEREYFGHVDPDGKSPVDRFGELFPSECRAVGENVAFVGTVGTDDADAVAERIVDGWMNSETHRENVLTARWDRQGIGVYIDDDRAYATQKFCDRR